MKKSIFRAVALFLALAFPSLAYASTCFWVPIVVSGAVSGTGSVCRLTVTAITGSGLVAGDSVIVAGLVGATECNGTTTISTVVDSTHIELTGTTFTSAYVSGGTVAGGHWTTTNTAMWASGTGGTVGTCAATGGVPKQTADTATFDGNAGGGTVVVDSTMSGTTISTLNAGVFTGTLTFAVNNPSMTFSGAFNISGIGTRTINCGTGTFTLTAAGNSWDASTSTNLTLICASGTISFATNAAFSGQAAFNTGGKTYGTVNMIGTNSANTFNITNSGATIATLNVTAPAFVSFASSVTITNALSWSGSSSSLIVISPPLSFGATNVTLSSAGSTLNWAIIRGTTFVTNSVTATNSYNMGGVTNASITNPSLGSAGNYIIGGM